jgi:hypothetical protein
LRAAMILALIEREVGSFLERRALSRRLTPFL